MEANDNRCPSCGGEICKHGICRDNWCGHDEHCSPCWRRAEAEREAEREYWYQKSVIGPLFGWDKEDSEGEQE